MLLHIIDLRMYKKKISYSKSKIIEKDVVKARGLLSCNFQLHIFLKMYVTGLNNKMKHCPLLKRMNQDFIEKTAWLTDSRSDFDSSWFSSMTISRGKRVLAIKDAFRFAKYLCNN